MGRALSNDLRARIPALHLEQGYTVRQISVLLGVKKSCVYSSLKNFSRFGLASNFNAQRGHRPRVLSGVDTCFIRAILAVRRTMYIDEIRDELYKRRGIWVSLSTITRTLARMRYTHKTVSSKAIERNELHRAIFMNQIGELAPDPAMLMFTEESAKDERTSQRLLGWSQEGVRCENRRVFVRGRRYSILPVLTLDGIITHDIIEGSVTAARFVEFLRDFVIPLTTPYPGPRSVLILDNCAIHHSEEVRELVEGEAMCRLVFLPPYSPDYNPIEMAFSVIKAYLRREWQEKTISVIDRACHSITPEHAWGFFRGSGYV